MFSAALKPIAQRDGSTHRVWVSEIPISFAEQVEADLFYQALGRTIGRWSTLEHYLGQMFTRVTNMEEVVSRSVFHSARSWRARYDMLMSALDASASKPGVVESWKSVVSMANSYAAFRNVLAHDHVQLAGLNKANGARLLVIRSAQADLRASDRSPFYHRNHIENAGVNFHLLGATVVHAIAHPEGDQLGSPERLQWLLSLLPAQPFQANIRRERQTDFELGLQRQSFPH